VPTTTADIRHEIDVLAATIEAVLTKAHDNGSITEMQRRTRKNAYTRSLNKLRQHTTLLESMIEKTHEKTTKTATP
jgi:hypothetical protein